MANGNSDAYKERYCAYVDILGFRGLVSKLRDGSREVRALRSLLTKIHEPFQETPNSGTETAISARRAFRMQWPSRQS